MVEQLSLETVIIVGCVCGTVVVILSIILVVLCCRRHEPKYYYEKADPCLGPAIVKQPVREEPRLTVKVINCDASPNKSPHTCQDHIGGYKCADHLTPDSNIDVQKTQNGEHCHNSVPATHEHVLPDRSDNTTFGTLTLDSKRPKKIIHEVIV